jgi:hypothetical protein
MANGYLDLVGTPALISLGTAGLNIGSNGAGLVRLFANAVPQMTVSSVGRSHRVTTVTDITTAGAGTYTGAQIATGFITRDPNGAGRTDTTDTATAILTAVTCLVDTGDTFSLYLINTADAAEAITLAGGTGVTFNNVGQTLAQNESALILFRRTSSSAITAYIIGA